MKTLLFLLSGILLLSFGEIEMKNGIPTRNEKFAGKVKSVYLKEYVQWNGQQSTEKDTLTWSFARKSSFDKQGIEIAESIYNREGKLVHTDTIKYDAHGNRLQRLFIDDKSRIYHSVYNKYDSVNNKIAEIEYGEKRKIESRFNYKYDDHGNCIEWIKLNAKGKKTAKHTYSYDRNNNILEEYVASTKLRRKFTYTYNSETLPAEKKLYINDSLEYREVNSYDEHNNLTQALRYTPDGHIDNAHSTITKYEYDKTGNWTKREVQSYEGKTEALTTRKFEYY